MSIVGSTADSIADPSLSTFDLGQQAANDLLAYCEAEDYRGYDPYDALNSPLLRTASMGMKYPRIAVTQALKKLPWNVRPLLMVSKGHNPKGIGLFLWSYVKLHTMNPGDRFLQRIDYLLNLLESTKTNASHGHGWGYNFPWQSRAFFVPRYTPTIVNSCFVGHALLDTHQQTKSQRALDMAVPIKDFLLRGLHRTWQGDTFCFSYTPIDQLVVHNANLLGASFLMRLHQYLPDEASREAALASLAYTMQHQRDDGSWWYADTDYQKWIDSFHTGFNLQCIQYFLKQGEATEYEQAFNHGTQFYVDNFFLDDGTAKYFHDRTYPIDVHSYAQAIVFLSQQGDTFRLLLDRVIVQFLKTFRSPHGYFYFQRYAKRTNKIPYMRWSQAWSLHALTSFLIGTKQSNLRAPATC